MCQRYPLKFVNNVTEFHLIGFEKFTAGGNIVKKIFNGEYGSYGAGARFMTYYFAGINFNLSTGIVAGSFGFYDHFRHRRNRSQGFASESFGGDIEKIL